MSYVISRAFFSTHGIRDLFHLASLDIQSSSPFDLYLQPTTGLLWLEAIFFQVLTSDPLRAKREFRQKSMSSVAIYVWAEKLTRNRSNRSSFRYHIFPEINTSKNR